VAPQSGPLHGLRRHTVSRRADRALRRGDGRLGVCGAGLAGGDGAVGVDIGIGIGLGISAVAAIAALIASLRNGAKIQDVHLTMNSRLDELLAATKAQAFAEGQEHQRVGDLERTAAGIVAMADAKAKVLDEAAARGAGG
jgi:hypothetical protein